MKNTYEITAPMGASLPIDTVFVGLDDDQVRRRRHQLEPLKGDRWKALASVRFKLGETVTIEGELPKVLAADVTPPPKKATPKKAAQPEAKKTKAKKAAKPAAKKTVADGAPKPAGDGLPEPGADA